MMNTTHHSMKVLVLSLTYDFLLPVTIAPSYGWEYSFRGNRNKVQGAKEVTIDGKLYEFGNVLGKGSFTTVRLAYYWVGSERKTAAVKIYEGNREQNEKMFENLEKVFETLHAPWCEQNNHNLKRMTDDEATRDAIRTAAQKTTDLFPQWITGCAADDGNFYVVMEKAECTLSDIIMKNALTDEERNRITNEIFIIMAVLHAKGLLHMDFKPKNLMKFGNTWKLIDLDSCVWLSSNGTALIRDRCVCSPLYCAPEVAQFYLDYDRYVYNMTKVGPGSYPRPHLMIHDGCSLDVWSVGMTLYELITGVPVLQEESRATAYYSAKERILKYLAGIKHGERWQMIEPRVDRGMNLIEEKVDRPQASAVALHGLIQRNMLVREGDRASIAQCLQMYAQATATHTTRSATPPPGRVRRFR